MAWNRPSTNGPTIQKKSGLSPVMKGLLGGGIIVAVLGVAMFFIFSGDDTPAPSTKHQTSRTIKEAPPAKAPEYKPVEEKVEKSKPKSAPWRNKNLSQEKRDELYEKHLAEQKIPEARTNRLFRTSLEQLMSWVFTTEVGDMPPPLLNIPDFDYVHLQEILELKNEVKDSDSETQAASKTAVDFAKKELKKYVEKGGDPQQFLKFYHDELKSAYQERQMAQQEVMKVFREEPDLVDDYIKKVNESLAQKGIKGVILSDRQRRSIEAKMLKEAEEN